MSSSLPLVKTFRLSSSPTITLNIVRGSVVDFSWHTPSKAAIVNAANEGCLGGGGVDGAISAAGGPNLHGDRRKLPVVEKGNVRCQTGKAKRTGPGSYGDLRVRHVIHAVGPRYNLDCTTDEEGDALLRSAYGASLDRAQEAHLEAICFSLLSAGVYRGDRTVKEVLSIALASICEWVQAATAAAAADTAADKKERDKANDKEECGLALQSIYMCGFNPHEVNMLVDICEDDLKLEIVDVPQQQVQDEDNDTASENNNGAEDMDITLDDGEDVGSSPKEEDKGKENDSDIVLETGDEMATEEDGGKGTDKDIVLEGDNGAAATEDGNDEK